MVWHRVAATLAAQRRHDRRLDRGHRRAPGALGAADGERRGAADDAVRGHQVTTTDGLRCRQSLECDGGRDATVPRREVALSRSADRRCVRQRVCSRRGVVVHLLLASRSRSQTRGTTTSISISISISIANARVCVQRDPLGIDKLAVAMLSGVSAVLFAAPLDLIKSRVQSGTGLESNLSRIVANEGVRALYRGAGIKSLRVVLGSYIFLVAYEHMVIDATRHRTTLPLL